MISYDEALRIVLQLVKPLEAERTGIINALGRTLAEDVYALEDIPPFRNSAVDGYAVIAEDTRGASAERPKALRLAGEVAAGAPPDLRAGPGSAVRIMTGAQVPDGADAVVMIEVTRAAGDTVEVLKEGQTGDNIRPAGEDARAGVLVLTRGTLIGPAEMGLLAAVGASGVDVTRRPRVSVLTTGDELVDLPERLGPGKIRNSNRYSLSGQVLACGCELNKLLHAGDDPGALTSAVESAGMSDAIVTAGGISVGKYDYVGKVLSELGEVMFWKVAIKPGKPTAFAIVGGRPVFALPGNPTSAIVTFELFVRPALLAMLGRRSITRRIVPAVLGEDIAHTPGRREFVRVAAAFEDGRLVVRRSGRQGSGLLTPMAAANALAIIPEDRASLSAGDQVKVMLLDSFVV